MKKENITFENVNIPAQEKVFHVLRNIWIFWKILIVLKSEKSSSRCKTDCKQNNECKQSMNKEFSAEKVWVEGGR